MMRHVMIITILIALLALCSCMSVTRNRQEVDFKIKGLPLPVIGNMVSIELYASNEQSNSQEPLESKTINKVHMRSGRPDEVLLPSVKSQPSKRSKPRGESGGPVLPVAFAGILTYLFRRKS